MHFFLFLVCLLSIFHSVQATEILTPESDHKRYLSYTPNQNNNIIKETNAMHHTKQNSLPLKLDDEDYDNAFLSSEYSQEAAQAYREKNYAKASEYYIRAAWAGEDDSLHYLDDLLSNSGQSVFESYNDEDKETFSKYFEILIKILQEKQDP